MRNKFSLNVRSAERHQRRKEEENERRLQKNLDERKRAQLERVIQNSLVRKLDSLIGGGFAYDEGDALRRLNNERGQTGREGRGKKREKRILVKINKRQPKRGLARTPDGTREGKREGNEEGSRRIWTGLVNRRGPSPLSTCEQHGRNRQPIL